jgi:hypothetical protein
VQDNTESGVVVDPGFGGAVFLVGPTWMAGFKLGTLISSERHASRPAQEMSARANPCLIVSFLVKTRWSFLGEESQVMMHGHSG